jgi:uncharacterized membrane protein YphA (DoxX/SURF4 family)
VDPFAPEAHAPSCPPAVWRMAQCPLWAYFSQKQYKTIAPIEIVYPKDKRGHCIMLKQYMENVNLQKLVMIISAVIRIFVGGFLVFSSYAKYVSSVYYLKFIMRLGIPYEIADKTVIPLIIFEMLFGLLLIVGYRTTIMLRLTALLFLVFTAIVTYSMVIGIDVSCGCFGPYFRSEINYLSIARNLIIAIGTFLISFSKQYPFTIDSLLAKRLLKNI